MDSVWIIVFFIFIMVVAVMLSIGRSSSGNRTQGSSGGEGESMDEIRDRRRQISQRNAEVQGRITDHEQRRVKQLRAGLESRPAVDFGNGNQKQLGPTSGGTGGRGKRRQLDDGETITSYPEDVPPQLKDGR